MKLLSQKQLNTALQTAKKQEIDEGVKLAKRVDSVRQTLNDEETSLTAFRNKKVGEIHKEIDDLIVTKSGLIKDVDELTRKRQEQLVPLDDEWERLNKAKAMLEEERQNLDLRAGRIEQMEAEAREKLTTANSKLEHVHFCEEEATKNLNDAILVRREAKEMSEAAANALRESESHKSSALADITEEHRKLDLRQQNLTASEEQNRKEKKEIADTKRQLADERETLIRTRNRKS